METRRPSRHGTTRAAAAIAQEVICCIMSSTEDNNGNLVINEESSSSGPSPLAGSGAASASTTVNSSNTGAAAPSAAAAVGAITTATASATSSTSATNAGSPASSASPLNSSSQSRESSQNTVKPLKIGIKRDFNQPNRTNKSNRIESGLTVSLTGNKAAAEKSGFHTSLSSSYSLSSSSSSSSSPSSPLSAMKGKLASTANGGTSSSSNNNNNAGNNNGRSYALDSMYEAYQTWASKTYGDSAKTKTVTKKKYSRIVKILRGEESTSVENSKFRFWVKAKGFKLGPVKCKNGLKGTTTTVATNSEEEEGEEEQVLYVPCPKATTGSSGALGKSCNGNKSSSEMTYKRVAVVENFYAIIYDVHVEMDGRSGKHAGQKRTYRAVAEMYAFLPREAVTRFLMSCSDCQKRMHLQDLTANGSPVDVKQSHSISTPAKRSHSSMGGSRGSNGGGTMERKSSSKHDSKAGLSRKTVNEDADMDYSLPITTTYLKRMKSLGFNGYQSENFTGNGIPELGGELSITEEPPDNDEQTSIAASEAGTERSGEDEQDSDGEDALTSSNQETYEIVDQQQEDEEEEEEENYEEEDDGFRQESAAPIDMSKVKLEPEEEEEEEEEEYGEEEDRQDEPLNMTSNRSYVSQEPKRKASHVTRSTRSGKVFRRHNSHDVYEAGGRVEEEEDDDEEEESDVHGDHKSDHVNFDPERLKAFNMFVRLFVDENLDRMVPISRQPKEKIQAIIDSCARQFPEFGERSRKRIRTYLKSCRRTRRHKNAISEKEGGSKNESRTIPPSITSSTYHLTSPMAEQILASACDNECKNAKRMRLGLKPLSANTHENEISATNTPALSNAVPASSSAVQVLKPNSNSTSNSLLAAFTNHVKNEAEQAKADSMNVSRSLNKQQENGVVFSCNHNSNPPPKYSLNPSEVAAVKQLIAGYRESAAFLLRSADELEHLLLQQT